MMKINDVQLTHAPNGHTINTTQVFSKDDVWIVFDARNDDAMLACSGSIGLVHVATGEVKVLYVTNNQTVYGPGVGAATFSPVADKVLFIHGLRNAAKDKPYAITRRTGTAIDISKTPYNLEFMDARNVDAPYTPGALRGGTHAHTWSGDGNWISFTYNDYVIEQLSLQNEGTTIHDLRTVGVMFPKPVFVEEDDQQENHSGSCFAVVIAQVTDHPAPGSDEINKAFDECWIGTNGYLKADGSRQVRAIAFQGNVCNAENKTVTEVFVADLPEDPKDVLTGGLIEETETTRLNVPANITQRRITFSTGIEGPRHWLRSSPDGTMIAFLMKDSEGLIQLFSVSPLGGEIKQLTFNAFSVQGPFNISPDGKFIAYPADNRIMLTDLITGVTTALTTKFPEGLGPVGAPCWANNKNLIAYNRYVENGIERFLQIFLLEFEIEK